jgi:hypothetical protein
MALFISTLVQWVIIPLIMLAIFGFCCVIVGTARTSESRISSWADLFAGLLIFVVYVVSQLGQIREPNFAIASLPGMLWLPMGYGLAAGFVFLGFVQAAVPTRLVGLITLTLAASSTSAIFTYTFVDQLRLSVLYWTLGATLGTLVHIVLFPTSIDHIARRGGSRGLAPTENLLPSSSRLECLSQSNGPAPTGSRPGNDEAPDLNRPAASCQAVVPTA